MSRRAVTDQGSQAAAIGCRAHTGWAVLVAVAGVIERPRVLFRCRVELADPAGHVPRNVYQANRGRDPVVVARVVERAERIAKDQAAAGFEQGRQRATSEGVALRTCAVVVGPPQTGIQLESILASHALAHAAEGRLYQGALLEGAQMTGLAPLGVPRGSIWELAESALRLPREDLRQRVDRLRKEVGPPWAQDQKLAAIAAWISLAG